MFSNSLENYDQKHIIGNSTSFELPNYLQDVGNYSFEVIWPKGKQDHCVCPLVENLLPSCACNTEYNIITLSGSTMTVFNINTQDDILSIYFTHSTSQYCNGVCRLRRILGAFQIYSYPGIISHAYNISPGLYWSCLLDYHPVIFIKDEGVCFNSTYQGPVQYEVNITDVAGYLSPQSGTYIEPKCLDYDSACPPYNVTVKQKFHYANPVESVNNTMANCTDLFCKCRCLQSKGNTIIAHSNHSYHNNNYFVSINDQRCYFNSSCSESHLQCQCFNNNINNFLEWECQSSMQWEYGNYSTSARNKIWHYCD